MSTDPGALSTDSAPQRHEDMMGVMADRLGANLAALADTREFGAWMAAEQRRIFLLCRRMLQDIEDADAATQGSGAPTPRYEEVGFKPVVGHSALGVVPGDRRRCRSCDRHRRARLDRRRRGK